jgi:tripartite-type tricarboxylate transporter receptor subunit TctC
VGQTGHTLCYLFPPDRLRVRAAGDSSALVGSMMYRPQRRALLRTLAALLAPALSADAMAALPREITVHVPFPPGGSPDLLARLIADSLRDRLGVSVVVLNTSGVNGEVGLRRFLQQEPDGGHWLIAPDSLITINPFVFPRSSTEPLQGLQPIVSLAGAPQFLLVNAADPIDSLAALARAGQSAPIDFGSGGVGGQPHLLMVQLAERLQLRTHHVPYRNNGLAALGVARGEVRAVIAGTSSLALVRGGKLKIIAVSTADRHPGWPQVRTFAEDLPGFSILPWIGLFGQHAAPAGAVESMTLAVRAIVEDVGFGQNLENRSGLQPLGLPQVEFRRLIADDLVRYRRILSLIDDSKDPNRPGRSSP